MSDKNTSHTNRKVSVAAGDGIGPEIMAATLKVLIAANARIDFEMVEIGESLWKNGHTSGISPEAWQSITRSRVLLKGPVTTPTHAGVKSLNVTLRKTLGLYANVRPCRSFAPFVKTAQPGLDVVILRENEEDLFCGIEHRQTDDVYQALRVVSRPGTERIVRFAFEFARHNRRNRITCITNDHILKFTDGIFRKVFEEIGAEYPDIEQQHMISDTGAAKLVQRPEMFDVIVTPNIYGDVLSDVAAQLSGSVGMAGTANIGSQSALFEAIHGSAPKYKGLDLANPSGLLTAARLMLSHIGQDDVGELIRNAWLRTLEDGIHTYDIHDSATSRKRVGTKEFGQAVIDRLGETPRHLRLKAIRGLGQMTKPLAPRKVAVKELVGVDVFIHDRDLSPTALAVKLTQASQSVPEFKLEMITSRGVKVWPEGHEETFMADHWRCRFTTQKPSKNSRLIELLKAIDGKDLDIIKTENLYTFDGEIGFSRGQGQ